MRCPIALLPEIEGPSQVLLHDDYHVVIDGCKAKCLAKSYEKLGLKANLIVENWIEVLLISSCFNLLYLTLRGEKR